MTLSNFSLLAQEEEIYPSSEEKEYYEKMRKIKWKRFKPISKRRIKKFNLEYIEIQESPSKNNPFISIWEMSEGDKLYEKKKDSCDALYEIDSDLKNSYDCYHHIETELWNDTIGSVSKRRIMKYDDKRNPSLYLYQDTKYEDEGLGYWIAEFLNGRWNYYYTGLTENYPFYIKPNSTLPLRGEGSLIQLEAAKIRQVRYQGPPFDSPLFELVEDHLILQLDLSKIKKDSDGDGLTDIEERKLFTNPNLADSDGDGLNDFIDKVPLSKVSESNLVNVYNFMIHQRNSFGHGCEIDLDSFYSCFISESIPFECNEKELSNNKAYIVIHDDPAMKAICSDGDRYIVLNEKEFELYNTANKLTPIILNFSPLFKVDGKKDTYKIHLSYSEAYSIVDIDYAVKKVEGGWQIKVLSFIMGCY